MDVNDFFLGGGGESFKFTNIGDTVKGDIVSLEPQQQKDFKTKEPLFWKDGGPRMQVKIVLATDLRDDDDDNGHRAIFAKGALQYAIGDAVKKAGAKKIETGGTLAVRFSGLGEAEAGLNPPKLFEASYKAPAAGAISVDDLI